MNLILAPGDGELFEAETDQAMLPIGYADDFADDRFKRDAVSYQNIARFDVGWYGQGLSAATGNLTSDEAYVIYDLDALLGADRALRAVVYDGAPESPSSDRGVFASVSQDGVTFTPLAGGASGIGIPFTGRYLKFGVSYFGAGGPWYGYLKRIAFAGWPGATAAHMGSGLDIGQ